MLALKRYEELPAAPADFALVHFALEPGARSAIETGAGPLLLFAVEAGAFTFRVDTPTTVTRGGALATAAAGDGAAPGEAVPAGTEFTLGPGDSALFLPETTGEIRNAGAERAVGIGAFLESAEEDAAAAGAPPSAATPVV